MAENNILDEMVKLPSANENRTFDTVMAGECVMTMSLQSSIAILTEMI